jgi:hypothetical protein
VSVEQEDSCNVLLAMEEGRGNKYDNYDGEEKNAITTITTSINTVSTTSNDITNMPSTKGTPIKIAKWRDLTTDQKWEYQLKHLVEYKNNSGNLSMPRDYKIKMMIVKL